MKPNKRKPKAAKRRQQAGDSQAILETHQDAAAVVRSDTVETESNWGRGTRTIASVAIFGYLALLILGPLSNPVASQHLTAPIAAYVAPVHRALFMGHGYRFFAPNPGASHIVNYKITCEDGTQIEGTFPDRKSMQPRLHYHRWFMLSETVFSEHEQTPSRSEFTNLNQDKKRRVKLLTAGGKLKLAQQLEIERVTEEARYNKTMERIQTLVKSIGGFLLKKHDGQEIELSVATRTIPYPAEIQQGADLGDDVFLRYPTNAVIGRFTISDFDDSESSENPKASEMEETP